MHAAPSLPSPLPLSPLAWYISGEGDSHFSWEASDHQLLIVDIQGVGDFYTDPQVARRSRAASRLFDQAHHRGTVLLELVHCPSA